MSWSQIIGALSFANKPPLIASFVIGIPSALLYLAESVNILVHRKTRYNSSFYALFLVRSIMDLLNYATSFVEYRIGLLGYFLPIYLAMPGWLLASYMFIIYYTFHGQNIATAAMLANRLTAIHWASQYKTFWQHALPIAIALVILIPIAPCLPIFDQQMFVRIQADNQTFTLDSRNKIAINPLLILTIGSLAFMVVSLGLNIAILIAYKRRASEVYASLDERSVANSRRTEHRLTIYAAFTFLGHFLGSLYEVLLYAIIYVMPKSDEQQLIFLALYNQLPWLNDVTVIAIPSFLLVWASDEVRSDILNKPIHAIMSRAKCFLSSLNCNFTTRTTIKVTKLQSRRRF